LFTGIAADQPFDTNEDASPSRLVSERVDPLRVLIGLLYSRGDIVAQRLHMSIVGVLRGLTPAITGRQRAPKAAIAAPAQLVVRRHFPTLAIASATASTCVVMRAWFAVATLLKEPYGTSSVMGPVREAEA